VYVKDSESTQNGSEPRGCDNESGTHLQTIRAHLYLGSERVKKVPLQFRSGPV